MDQQHIRLIADIVNRVSYVQSLIGAPLISDLEVARVQEALRDEEKRNKAVEAAQPEQDDKPGLTLLSSGAE